jgi:hypothetical protein
MPTATAIVGDKIASGLADRYLAANGYDAQQTNEPENPQRRHNLWEPVDDGRDFGPHGRFGAIARSTSYEVWPAEHHGAAALLVGSALAALSAAVFLHRRRRLASAARELGEPVLDQSELRTDR